MLRKTLCSLVAMLALAVNSCTPTSPSQPRIVLPFPEAGQTLKIGEGVVIRWSCDNCETVVDKTVTIDLVQVNRPPQADYGMGRVVFGPLSGSAPWIVGATARQQRVPPGLYRLSATTLNCRYVAERTCAYDAGGGTDVFQIVD